MKQQASRRRIGSLPIETPPTRHNIYKNKHLCVQIYPRKPKGCLILTQMMRIIGTEKYICNNKQSKRVENLVEFVAEKAGDDEFGDVGSVRTPARGTHG